MFRGRFLHAIDSKGRVSIPAGFRMELQRHSDRTPILSILPDCLALYPAEQWDLVEKRITDLDPLRIDGHSIQRFLISSCVECPLDAQGRILIPPFLREHARLEKEVMILGAGKRIELWEPARAQQELNRTQAQFGEISSEVSKLG
jgi:MraZ protein